MFRYFITTLTHFRTSSILNIGGLTVAYIAFIIISLQIISEYSYDSIYRNSDRIYRVERTAWSDSTKWDISLSRPAIDIIAHSSSDIEECAIIKSRYLYDSKSTWRLEGTTGDEGLLYHAAPIEISSEFAQMFDIKMIDGVMSDDQQKAIIPKSLATKLFGKESAIDKVFMNTEIGSISFTVCGVYEDFPATSSFSNNLYCNISNKEAGMYNYMNYTIFIKLRKKADLAAIEQTINKEVNESSVQKSNLKLRLHKISDIHLSTDMNSSIGKYGNTQKNKLFGFIAILIMFIASINYINFSTALVPLRIRGINTRKIFGATVASLRIYFIGETVGISIIAYIMAALVVCSFDDISGVSFISTHIDIAHSLPTIALLGLFAVILGFLAGIYPAFYSTSFKMAYVLKGSFSLSPKGRALRSAMVGFQFVISIGLIIASMFMNLQFSMIKNKDLGVDKENIIRINIKGNLSLKTEELKGKLSNIAGVTAVTNTPMCVVGTNYSTYTVDSEGKQFYNMHAPSNAVDFFGFQIIEGRNFTIDDDLKPANNTVLINESAQKKYNLKLGDKINNITSINGYWVQEKGEEQSKWEIIGVVKNFNFKPLYEQVEPLMIISYGTSSNHDQNTIYVKTASDNYPAIIKDITSIVKEFDANWLSDIAFLDSSIEELYQSDLRSASLINWFSLLAILISLAGVFGLVHFEVGYRCKEIGLRKISGATVTQIIAMISNKFLIMTIICYLVATPLAIYFVAEWLSVFAYRTPLCWWVFVAALLIILFVTLITVLIQSYKAATDNPINSIKTE